MKNKQQQTMQKPREGKHYCLAIAEYERVRGAALRQFDQRTRALREEYIRETSRLDHEHLELIKRAILLDINDRDVFYCPWCTREQGRGGGKIDSQTVNGYLIRCGECGRYFEIDLDGLYVLSEEQRQAIKRLQRGEEASDPPTLQVEK